MSFFSFVRCDRYFISWILFADTFSSVSSVKYSTPVISAMPLP